MLQGFVQAIKELFKTILYIIFLLFHKEGYFKEQLAGCCALRMIGTCNDVVFVAYDDIVGGFRHRDRTEREREE